MNILITGASSGIGQALALEYAKDKDTILFLNGRDETRLTQTKTACEALGAKVYERIIDVTAQQKMQEWITDCNQKHELNLVIANAGISCGEETPENIYCTFNTNIFGVLNTITPALEIFKNRLTSPLPLRERRKPWRLCRLRFPVRGTIPTRQSLITNYQSQIAIISSLAGYHGLASAPSYSAAKACVKAYGEALRARHQKDGIKINVICPGFVRSRITDKNKFPMPFFMEAAQAARLIKKRLEKNIGLIAFPWPLRLAVWFVSILPNRLSNLIYARLPDKSN